MVPKNHQLFMECLPIFSIWPSAHLSPKLKKDFFSVRAKAGDMIVYLEKTLHGSYPNEILETRPVFHGSVIHKKAKIQYIRLTESQDEVEI